MRNIQNVSRVCFLLALNFITVRTDAVNRNNPVVVYPSVAGGPVADKPALVQMNSVCEPKFVNGKKIINNVTNPQECAIKAQEKARQKREVAMNAATQVIKKIESAPDKPEECIRTISNSSQECLKNKITKNSQVQPKYVVANKSNKVDVFEDGVKVFMGVRVQTHYKEKPQKPKPSKFLTEYPEVVVFNELGDIIATKTPKARKVESCICPLPGSPAVPQTSERILNSCIKPDCNTSGIMTSILSNSTVTPATEAEASKPSHDNKENGKESEKK